MRSGAAAFFVLLLIESEQSGEDGREPCGSGRYSLADPRTLLWGESSAFNLLEPHYICRIAPYKVEGRRRRTKEVWSKNYGVTTNSPKWVSC